MEYNIAAYHNGLGDILQFSTLPELLAKNGHEISLYEGAEVLPYRNPELRKLWTDNPYIAGTSRINWNCGDIPGLPYKNTTGSFIKNWEVAFGMSPTNELPIIYQEPQVLPRVYGLIELSSITLKYNAEAVLDEVRRIIASYDMPFAVLVSQYQNGAILPPNVAQKPLSGIFHAYDLFCSCRCLITLNSGLHAVGAAARRHNNFDHYCFIPDKDWEWIMSERKFIFEGIKYIRT